jgi:hypothetical protein
MAVPCYLLGLVTVPVTVSGGCADICVVMLLALITTNGSNP